MPRALARLACSMLLILLPACAGDSLQTAAKSGDLAGARRHLFAGAEVNQRDGQGNTALYHAARHGDVEMARLLLEHGADVDNDNAFGSTPLHVASRYGHVAIIELLIAHGATIDVRNFARQDLVAGDDRLAARAQGGRAGVTPLVRAAKAGQLEAVQALVEAGAELPALEAVQAASLAGHTEVAAYLSQATRQRREAGGPLPRVMASRYERRLGALIGISHYRGWPPLEGAAKDARRVAAHLRDMAFDELIEVYDQEATRRQVLTLLGEELQAKTGANDLVFIYFAGHGQTETLPGGEKRGYVIPADANPEDSFATGISMQTLRDLSNRLTAKHVYYVMDSCYSGLGLSRDGGGGGRPERQGERLRAVQMLTAGGEGQQALERGGQGLFTRYLLRALSGEADRNGDGVVTASEIGDFVAQEVTSASNGRQTPLYGTLEGSGELALEVHVAR